MEGYLCGRDSAIFFDIIGHDIGCEVWHGLAGLCQKNLANFSIKWSRHVHIITTLCPKRERISPSRPQPAPTSNTRNELSFLHFTDWRGFFFSGFSIALWLPSVLV